MKTLILPGFSLKNKDWAEEVKSKLPTDLNAQVIYWKHWQTGKSTDFNPDKEAQKAIELIGQDDINIIAKSIGTYVAVLALQLAQDQINKLLLCGIPLNDMDEAQKNKMMINLRVVSTNNLLCIQNTQDPHATYDQVKAFLESVNPAISLISIDHSDHEYPYFTEFSSFLLQ
jgi:predicted alpha/beta hydrolase family esterase